jgi:hypothetical protein
MSFHVPEPYRLTRKDHPLASDSTYGNNGCFILILHEKKDIAYDTHLSSIHIIASDGGGWEHVSASYPNRCPTWDEMCAVKDIFWDPEDVVMQLHPARSQHVNIHDFCLHLWRKTYGEPIPVPPSYMVGPRAAFSKS